MKSLFSLLISAVLINVAIAQDYQTYESCLPGGITFSTQAQIDNFPINYPDCTEIEGDVGIGVYFYGSDITNLNGLAQVTSLSGELNIFDNFDLTSLTGLENIISIHGDLKITGNDALINLTGLDNLTSLGGDLHIGGNSSLTSLTGLDNLISIEGNLEINGNAGLTSLSGLNNVTSIGGALVIAHNTLLVNLTSLSNLGSVGGELVIERSEALTSLSGLNNLASISGNLSIVNNNALSSLTGLDSFDGQSINSITIYENSLLSTCDVTWLCDYLSSPNGVVTIMLNASDCNSPIEIGNACGISIPCLPFGNYFISSQAEIDSFSSDYVGCTELEGDLLINGDDITNLNGLDSVSSIGGSLWLFDNDVLTDLMGLSNVISIGEDFVISENNNLSNLNGLNNVTSVSGTLVLFYNPSVTSLSGLENLNYIGGKLDIRAMNALTNLTGLENLNYIGGHLGIGSWEHGNPNLTSLLGLDNVTFIGGNLIIQFNPSLKTCETKSICDYLENPNGNIIIHDNAAGCNSQEDVEEACLVGLDEKDNSENDLIIYPNPTSNHITIELRQTTQKNRFLFIYSLNGQQLITQSIIETQTVVDVSGLHKGIYFVKLVDDEKVMVQKMIKQ